MRLLNTESLQLEEFQSDIPPYAILSHTWENQEVSFEDVSSGRHSEKAGWSKVRRCASIAFKDGFLWVWIDTCCIDKRSSAELSEAINSMFAWYAQASVCYAYLNDFSDHDPRRQPFADSRWFSRGWTLQELIAPPQLWFFDRDWRSIGSRLLLAAQIEDVTSISASDIEYFRDCSIAKRMSWASKRQTTRTEDLAYSLMGLFDINMPLLYGEGDKAFIRLQYEIIKTSADESIFAWDTAAKNTYAHTLLAPHPSAFALCGDRVPVHANRHKGESYVMSNTGLQITAQIWEKKLENWRSRRKLLDRDWDAIILLNCRTGSADLPCAIRLRSTEGGTFVRRERAALIPAFEVDKMEPSWTSKTLRRVVITSRRNPERIKLYNALTLNVEVALEFSNGLTPLSYHVVQSDLRASNLCQAYDRPEIKSLNTRGVDPVKPFKLRLSNRLITLSVKCDAQPPIILFILRKGSLRPLRLRFLRGQPEWTDVHRSALAVAADWNDSTFLNEDLIRLEDADPGGVITAQIQMLGDFQVDGNANWKYARIKIELHPAESTRAALFRTSQQRSTIL